MKKSLLTLTLACAVAVAAYADTITYGGINYTSTDGATATATSFSTDVPADVTIPYTFTVDDVTYTVTAISFTAADTKANITSLTLAEGFTIFPSKFVAGNTNLKSVNLPSTLTNIEASAFQGCSALASLDIPESVTTLGNYFANGTAITELIIPANVKNSTATGSPLFGVSNCPNLTKITFKGQGIMSLGLFQNNPKLTSITVPASVVRFASANPFLNTPISEIIFEEGSKLNSMQTNFLKGNKYLTTIQLPDGLTSIPGSTFSGCTALTDVKLGSKTTSIGTSAFTGCTSLKTIDLPETVTTISANAFQNCTAFESIELGSKVSKIGGYAFAGTTALKSIVIPASVTTIQYNAFSGSDLSEGITFAQEGSKLTTIEYGAFAGAKMPALILPNSITTLGQDGQGIVNAADNAPNTTLKTLVLPDNTDYYQILSKAFANCTALESVTIPDGITSFGQSAFAGCGFSEIVMPANLTEIGGGAFKNCKSLEKVDLSKSKYLMTIAGEAFNGCSSLSSVDFTDQTYFESIGNQAFLGCTSLSSATFTGCTGLTSIGNQAFYNCAGLSSVDFTGCTALTSIGASAFANCALTDVVIPEKITKIAESSFAKNPLATVTLPAGVTAIDKNAFQGHSLTELTLPQGLLTIGESAFSAGAKDKSSMTKLVIPSSVTSIGNYGFSYLNSLYEIIIDGDYVFSDDNQPAAQAEVTPLSIGSGAFSNSQPHYVACNYTTPPTMAANGFDRNAYNNTYLIVPTESDELYKEATGWQEFSQKVLTDIEDVATDGADRYVVYDMLGIKRLDTADRSLIDTLPAGLYIVNGRKQLVK
ncbi:MAG: leucine-rich repeat domain-containing protein [Bacteroides sp.]|nr:leucine-rich repeat domain-containing protein [Bacteroides sp.]